MQAPSSVAMPRLMAAWSIDTVTVKLLLAYFVLSAIAEGQECSKPLQQSGC
jgi:hypothetical protein